MWDLHAHAGVRSIGGPQRGSPLLEPELGRGRVEFAKDKPVSLRGAPPQCPLTFDLPHQPSPAEQLRLGQLDNAPLDASSSFGEIFASNILVKKRALGTKSQIKRYLQLVESDVRNRFMDSCNFWLFPVSQDRDDGFHIGTSWLSTGQLANRNSHVIRQAQQLLRLKL
jgi:hypothetical protein